MSLSSTSIGMAQVVSKTLENRGIELSALPETPVGVLSQLSCQQLILDEGVKSAAGGFERPELAVSLLSGSDDALPGQPHSAHSLQMDECVVMLANSLNGTLDLAQNVVNPTIDRVVKSVGDSISAALEATQSPLEIVQQRPDPIFTSAYLQESTERYVNQPRVIALRSLGAASIAGNVRAFLLTGHAGMDVQLEAFLGRMGEDFALSVWDRIFGAVSPTSDDVYSRQGQQNEAVFAYFFAARMAQEVPPGLNVDLSIYREYCASVLSSAGACIQAYFRAREQQARVGRMVLSYPMQEQPTGQVVVDGDKYTLWLEQGGTPELLFATIYGDRNFDNARMIDRAEQLNAEWSRVMALYQTTVSSKRFDAAVEGLKRQITVEINNIPDDQLVGTRAEYHDRLRERLRHAKMRDLEDQWNWARKAVCRVIYPHTDAETLLDAIDEQCKNNPDMPVREAALFATIDLVASWVTYQLARQYHN